MAAEQTTTAAGNKPPEAQDNSVGLQGPLFNYGHPLPRWNTE